ncbi:MAG: hypothetical protein ABGX04_07680 [Myxococcales bacterium]|nr:hypothetical protein [Myxococcales bacterium]HIK86014.1 hypothetical protein [Myxococcales bacterium]
MKFKLTMLMRLVSMACVAALTWASLAQADIVASGSQGFTEPNGFYDGVKSFTVYTDDDVANPMPGAPGEFTYLYTITNDPGSFIGIVGFNLDAPIGSVVSAGHLDDSDLATPPPAVLINNNNGVVRWDWLDPNLINPGQTADTLYVISTYTPGSLTDTIYSIEGNFAFDVEATCVGPLDPPVETCILDIAKEGCVVQPPSPPGDACEGKVTCFEFQYTGLGCDASSNLQDPKKTLCIGDAALTAPVDIVVTGNKHRKKKKRGWRGRKSSKEKGKKRKSRKNFASFQDVSLGDVHEVCASDAGKKNLGSSTKVKIKTANGSFYEVLELDKFHTSCSQPFGPGMQFGSLLITSVTSTKGGTVVLEEDPPDEMCVTEIDQTEPPHCVGKVTSLTLRYEGGDCSGSMNSQGPGKTGCTDFSAAGTYPVRVIVSDGAAAPPSTTAYVDVEPISIGDLITINASAAGHSQLKSVTGWWLKDAGDDTLRSDGFFHTSCSQAVNLGDQFGPLQVYSITSTGGGTVSLEHQVDYTYAVTNPNASDATNVSVNDDLLGNITSGQSIPAGATVVYTASSAVSQETTNIATVTGDVNGQMCEPATSVVTITVVEPPPTGTICASKIAAMRLLYTGPNILGAHVEIVPKTFPLDSVSYDLDLIGGVTELTLPAENGFSVDSTVHGVTDLGSKVKIFIDGTLEEIHTSCSAPFETGKPAPLNNPKGAPSPNWTVVEFTQKN